MILINTQKRTRLFTLPDFDETKMAGVPLDRGLPDGVFRLTTSTNDIPTERFQALHSHPDFQRAISQGHVLLVGDKELFRKVPMVKGKISVTPVKRVKKAGQRDTYEEQTAKQVDAKVIDPKFLAETKKWPVRLLDLKSLLAYENEQDAMSIAEYTVNLDLLKKWLKAERQAAKGPDDERGGVVETLEETIKKVEAFDLRVAKAKSGDTDNDA